MPKRKNKGKRHTPKGTPPRGKGATPHSSARTPHSNGRERQIPRPSPLPGNPVEGGGGHSPNREEEDINEENQQPSTTEERDENQQPPTAEEEDRDQGTDQGQASTAQDLVHTPTTTRQLELDETTNTNATPTRSGTTTVFSSSWTGMPDSPTTEHFLRPVRPPQRETRDDQWYSRVLLDKLFEGMKTPEEFLRMCSVIRESLDFPVEGRGPPAATSALRAKLIAHLHCPGLEGLAKAAREGDISRMEGLVLLEHFGYGLKKAYDAVRTMRQAPGEPLKDYTRRAVDLWRGIQRTKLVDKTDLDEECRIPKDRAARLWAIGITQRELHRFVELGIDGLWFDKKEASWLMELYGKAEAWLATRAKFDGCPILQPTTAHARGRQRQLVATIAPPSQVEPADGGRERQIPRPRRGRPEGPQREDQIRHETPCRICQKGTINRRKGCSNILCPTKIVFCRDCQEMTYHMTNGCSTAGCRSNRGTSQPLGNGWVRE